MNFKLLLVLLIAFVFGTQGMRLHKSKKSSKTAQGVGCALACLTVLGPAAEVCYNPCADA